MYLIVRPGSEEEGDAYFHVILAGSDPNGKPRIACGLEAPDEAVLVKQPPEDVRLCRKCHAAVNPSTAARTRAAIRQWQDKALPELPRVPVPKTPKPLPGQLGLAFGKPAPGDRGERP